MPVQAGLNCGDCGEQFIHSSVLTPEEIEQGQTGATITCPECGSGNVSFRTYHLFISHSWNYSDKYERLIELLEARPHFKFKNYSVPKDDPVHDADDDDALREAIRDQMSPCSAILILAGVYASYSKWIKEEIHLAQSGFANPKPIIAIKQWAAQRTSQTVTGAADEIVGWNTESVVKAIHKLT